MEVKVESSVQELGSLLGVEIVRSLSIKYGFDEKEALGSLKIEDLRLDRSVPKVSKTSKKKTTIPLPFCGVIIGDCCEAVRLNHGLYTQCTNEGQIHTGKYPVCTTCEKQIEKNSNNEPTYGYIRNRLEKGEDFRDPKGKPAVNYGNVMEKLNITKEAAIKAAKEFGLTIPDEQFEVKKAQRGRPKKDTTTNDTSDSEVESKSEKKRGRPKKEKKVVSANPGDAIIHNLVEKANGKENAKPEPEPESDSEDEEEVSVKPIKITKKGYTILAATEDGQAPPLATHLINELDNTLYDPESFDKVGVWNPKTNRIETYDSDTE